MAKKQTYADRAKAIMSKYKTRLGEKFDKGDALALEAMNQELRGLQREQEKARIQKMIEGANDEQISQLSQALQGGGQGQQSQFQPQNNQGPQQPGIPQGGPSGLATGQAPQATGQPQFRGGGKLPKYFDGGTFTTHGQNTYLGTGSEFDLPLMNTVDAAANDSRRFTPGQFDQFAPTPGLTTPQMPTNMATDQNLHLGNRDALNLNQGIVSPQTQQAGDGFTPFKSRVPYFGAIAQGLGSLIGNRNIDFEDYNVEDIKAERLTPRTVDFSRGREQTMRERDLSQAMIRGAAKGRGTQQGLTQTTIAGATAAQRQAGSEFNKSVESQGNINAQIRNEVAARNQQSQLQAAMANQRNQQYGSQVSRENQLINEQRRSQRIGGVTGAITGYGRDLLAADQYDQMLQIMAPDNYQFGAGQDSRFRKFAQVSPTMQRSFSDLGQRLYNKQK